MQRAVCIRVIRENVIELHFNIQSAAQRGSRWNQTREGRLTDERGVRDDDEIVGCLSLDFARAGGTREGRDLSVRIAGRKRKGSRRSSRDQQEQTQCAGGGSVVGG